MSTMQKPGFVNDAESQDPLLGYGFEIKNEQLGIQCFGSPHEVMNEVALHGLSFDAFANHPATSIGARKVYKSEPELAFSGGPHAEAILDLMTALDAHDFEAAEKILNRHPELVRDREEAIAVPILGAIVARDVAVVRFLAERVGLNVASHFGMAPLHWAAVLGDAEITRLLVESGAERTTYSWFLVTPAELALLNGWESIAVMIAEELPLGPEEPNARTVLERMRRGLV